VLPVVVVVVVVVVVAVVLVIVDRQSCQFKVHFHEPRERSSKALGFPKMLRKVRKLLFCYFIFIYYFISLLILFYCSILLLIEVRNFINKYKWAVDQELLTELLVDSQ